MESLGAALGIDLGGTAIKAGIVDGKGNILVAGVVPTLPDTGWENVVGRIVRLARELMDEAGMPVVRRVGIGIPGVVEPEEGRVVMAPNLGWKDVPVGKRLSEDFGCPVYMDNDAHLAALGEYWVGAGQGARSLFLVTVGTGIGSAVI
ncbi:MAG: ROK family protein, partial [Clostridia bacterium]|nr:ROK family protein [Clostridia bacterium]